MMRFATLTTGLSLAIPVSAILVATDSPCGTSCGNVLDATTEDDVVCSESSYTGDTGALFQECMTCELNSTYKTDDNVTDTKWLLYNLRYAFSYCIFGVPTNDDISDSPCVTSKACGPYKDAIVYKNLSSKISEFGYCGDWPTDNTDDFDACTSCLRASNEYYLSNFFTVLQAGCDQKPSPGITLSLEGSVFADDVVNVTSPTPTASINPDWFDHGAVSLSGKVGIAFGCLAFLLFLAGFFTIWNGRRRRRAFLHTLETKQVPPNAWPARLNTSTSHADFTGETPVSQRPLRNWDDSPTSARSEKLYPQHVSPFASHYSSPVSATEAGLASWPVMGSHPQYQMHQGMEGGPAMLTPHYQSQVFSVGQDTTPSTGNVQGSEVSSLSDTGKGKERQESYEMQPVEGGNQALGTHAGYGSSNAFHQQQGYFDDPSAQANQYQPEQMFPNMYQQHQRSQQGTPGFEGDVKR